MAVYGKDGPSHHDIKRNMDWVKPSPESYGEHDANDSGCPYSYCITYCKSVTDIKKDRRVRACDEDIDR